MKLFFHETETLLNMGELLEKYSYREFLSPYRSTVNMLSFTQSTAIDSFLKEIDVDKSKAKFFFEYRVPVQQGGGPSSHTDVMIFNGNRCIAIEAKNTEPPYDKVNVWLTNPNRSEVLTGWLNLINSKANTALTLDDVQDITYQMIHRLASACTDETKKPELIYLYFKKKVRMQEYYIEQLTRLKQLVEDKIKIRLYFIDNTPTAEMINLQGQWDNSVRDLRTQVLAGLIANNLFTFDNVELNNRI